MREKTYQLTLHIQLQPGLSIPTRIRRKLFIIIPYTYISYSATKKSTVHAATARSKPIVVLITSPASSTSASRNRITISASAIPITVVKGKVKLSMCILIPEPLCVPISPDVVISRRRVSTRAIKATSRFTRKIPL